MPDSTPPVTPPGGTWMGFDFGRRRIGVAIGQTLTRTANALQTVAHGSEPDWQVIGRLFGEWRPAALVVGLPINAAGEETELSRQARAFGTALQARFGKPVFYMDERLTSMQAGSEFAELRASGGARRKDAARLDAMAAKIILENWLQSLPDPSAGSDP